MGLMKKIGSFFQGGAKQVSINSKQDSGKPTPPLAAFKMNNTRKKRK